MNWRSARLFDGSLFLSSGATTNELTVRSFPFGSRPVGFPPRSRGGQIFSNPRRTGRLVVLPRVTPPSKRPVHRRGSFRSREGGVQAGPSPEKPFQDPGPPGSSPPSFSFSSERFLSTWQGLGRSHPHLRGRCACDTHPFGENPARSVPFRSKHRHAQKPTCWRTSQQKQQAQHKRTASEFRAREKTRRRSTREPSRGFGRNDAGKWKKEERIGNSEEQTADERRRGWLFDPTIFARKIFHFRNREETEANGLENLPGLRDP